jgi:hypothetical protein
MGLRAYDLRQPNGFDFDLNPSENATMECKSAIQSLANPRIPGAGFLPFRMGSAI